MNIVIVTTTTTRDVRISINNKWYDVEVDINVPEDEISLNAWEQFAKTTSDARRKK